MSGTVYQLCDFFSQELLAELKTTIYNLPWYDNVPGGFLTNSPKRRVIALGDGAGVNDMGKFSSPPLPETYWTAGINTSHCTLATKPLQLPEVFLKIIPQLRKIFEITYPGAIIHEHTFTLAVCNYYSQPDMYIAAHTDGQDWYSQDTVDGSIFASLTFYPEGEPEKDSWARFQMKPGDKWETVTLKHESILIMSSDILHRVMPHLKSQTQYFKPRINITFRSIIPPEESPLLHHMGVANHARYYGIPHKIIIPQDCETLVKEKLLNIYNTFLESQNAEVLSVIIDKKNKKERTLLRQTLIKQFRTKYSIESRINNNMVLELFQSLIPY